MKPTSSLQTPLVRVVGWIALVACGGAPSGAPGVSSASSPPAPVASPAVAPVTVHGPTGSLATGAAAALPEDFPLPALRTWPATMVLAAPDTTLISLTPPDPAAALPTAEAALKALGCAPTTTVVSRMTVLACDAVGPLANIQVTLLPGPPARATVAYQKAPGGG